jgi:DNA-binding MarR family transcriptional regulator
MTKTEADDGHSGSSPAWELVVQLRGLTQGVQDFLAARAKELGLGTTDFIALIRATYGEGATGAQLAQAFGMRSSSVTGLADRLEAKGLIARRPHPTDRRTVLLHATRRGQSTVRRGIGPLVEQVQALADDLDADDRETIATFLRRVDDAIQASASASHGGRPRQQRRGRSRG